MEGGGNQKMQEWELRPIVRLPCIVRCVAAKAVSTDKPLQALIPEPGALYAARIAEEGSSCPDLRQVERARLLRVRVAVGADGLFPSQTGMDTVIGKVALVVAAAV